MKKYIMILMLGVLLTGCEKVETEPLGDYKEGTYLGSAVDSYGGSENTAFAVVYVDKNGMIKSVYVDTTYTKDMVVTTKKVLQDHYGMSSIAGTKEWDEQVQLLEQKIVEHQGIDFITWKDDEKTTTDSVSGVTIKIDAMYKAVTEALKQAHK